MNIKVKQLGLLICLINIISCNKPTEVTHYETNINKGWEFRKAGDSEWLPANIPGDVVSDLIRNNKIDDPFVDSNIDNLSWIDSVDWEYQTNFDVDADILSYSNVQLNFDGLDTYADVYLNDSLILYADNMFRTWTIPCKKLLKPENNLLKIYFHSPIKKESSLRKSLKISTRREIQTTRKASFQYGSKSSPRIISCGIWKPITLEAWSHPKITGVYCYPLSISEKTASYKTEIRFRANSTEILGLEVKLDQKVIGKVDELHLQPGVNKYFLTFNISNPKLWWPNGMGNQNLYKLSVRIISGKTVIHEKSFNLGVRKIEFVQHSDTTQTPYLKVNDVPVFIKGSSYMPLDLFPDRVATDTYKQRVSDFKSSNINLIRVWGGGIYESETFYNLCDEAGIMVWQDFMINGKMQDDDYTYLENFRKEATEQIKKLRNHPCLALWFGNADTSSLGAGVKKFNANSIKTANQKIFYRILPEVISTYDRQTPYLADWNDFKPFKSKKDAFENETGSIVNDKGMISFPSLKTIQAFTRKKTVSSVEVLKSRKIAGITFDGFNEFDLRDQDTLNLASKIYLTQINQADYLKRQIEFFRRNRQTYSGFLFRQLNDCWPTISKSIIDYYGRYKPSFYSVREAFSSLIVVPVLENGFINIYGISDQLKMNEGILLCKLIDFNGKDYFVKQIPVKINENSTTLLLTLNAEEVLSGNKKNEVCLLVQFSQPGQISAQNILYFSDPMQLALKKPEFKWDINNVGKEFNLIIKTDVLAKNVVFSTKSKDVHFSENNLDLLPDKRYKIRVIYNGTQDELNNDLTIKSLNDFMFAK